MGMIVLQYIYQPRQYNTLKYLNLHREVNLNNIQKFQLVPYINRLLQFSYVISVNSESYTKTKKYALWTEIHGF